VGRKAAAASLADIAAMGGIATSLVVGFGAPGDLPAAWAVSCAAGIREEAALVGAALVGGDVVEAPQVVISVTALGDLEGRAPVLRSGARAGDVVALAGRIGWSAAGLALLSRGFRSPKVLVDAHRFPQPPYAAGPLAAVAGATSMIDISDGLVADARHVAQASGVRIELDTIGWEVPEPLQAAASAYNVDPREWMLTGGEDHALLATFAATSDVPPGFAVIGRVVAGEPAVSVDGLVREAVGGHRHFG
jgi:thiamine-monophosphate kinase